MPNMSSPHRATALPQSAQSSKRWLALPLAALIVTFTGTAKAQSYMNMSLGGAFAPGVYGQIAIGNNPPPPLINVRPVIIGHPIQGAPVIYLHVSPQEYRHWGKYCSRYQACGRPVHFVSVNQRNRWWERHNEQARGDGMRARPDYRQGEQRDRRQPEGDGNRHDNRGN